MDLVAVDHNSSPAASWKIKRVISGHTGWVRSLAVDCGNGWFASGSADRTIKIWDLASGILKLTLTGHIGAIRALAISDRHPYLFSASDDKQVKCWDLEQNRLVRHYHGHLSGVQSLVLHPTLDLLISGGRDGCPRVWDMRTRQPIHTLTGHRDAVPALLVNEASPHLVSGSMDGTVRLWDLAAGRTLLELTHHKRGVRALAGHPVQFAMASASADAVKQWALPDGQFVGNFQRPPEQKGKTVIVNALAANADGLLVAGGDDGSLECWDWAGQRLLQSTRTISQPGSLEAAETGILAATFDRTGTRLLTGEVDKTIKVWWSSEEAEDLSS